jgi:hypothetical protein
MNEIVTELTKRLDLKPGASENLLKMVESQLGVSLPPEYADFLKYSNGAEGTIGENSYLVLWPVEEIAPLNKAYAVGEFAPGLLLFGSDGGGVGYAFDTRSETMPIVEVPFIGMNLNDTKLRGLTFVEFLEHLHSQA